MLKNVSGARRFAKKNDISSDYNYNDVFELAEESIALISEGIRIWRFHVHDDAASLRIYEKYCNAYWMALPRFSEVEPKI